MGAHARPMPKAVTLPASAPSPAATAAKSEHKPTLSQRIKALKEKVGTQATKNDGSPSVPPTVPALHIHPPEDAEKDDEATPDETSQGGSA